MSAVPSCEWKLRMLAQQNAALVSALTWPNVQGVETFMWMDEQLQQGVTLKPGDGKAAVTVTRVSSMATKYGNQGGPIQPLRAIKLQVNCISYNAEQSRQVAAAVNTFMGTISLCDAGEFGSPQTGPSQNPNFLINQRGTLWPQLVPSAYVQVLDYRVFNREDIG